MHGPLRRGCRGQPDFYWEFRLAARHDGEDNGWPDLAAVWPDRVLLFELKTEPGSVRDGPGHRYLDLALHHFRTSRVDLLYLTRDRVPTALPACRYGRGMRPRPGTGSPTTSRHPGQTRPIPMARRPGCSSSTCAP